MHLLIFPVVLSTFFKYSKKTSVDIGTLLLDFPRPRTMRQINFLLWLSHKMCPHRLCVECWAPSSCAIWGGSGFQLGEGGHWGHALELKPRSRHLLNLCFLAFVIWLPSLPQCHYHDILSHHRPRINSVKDYGQKGLRL